MPELPEVEVVVRGLKTFIVGKCFSDIQIKQTKLTNFSAKKFNTIIKKQIIRDVERIGKMIIIHLEKNILIFHLKMTGQLIYEKIFLGGHLLTNPQNLINKSTHLIFTLSDSTKLFYNDQRQFGYCHLIEQKELKIYAQKYGIEPINKPFKWIEFWGLVQAHPQLNLKTFLLNQKYIAGLGNIYVDEICFLSGVDSRQHLKKISREKWEIIFKNIPKILNTSIKWNGTTFSNYLNADGRKGNFAQFLKVYGRGGQSCVNCNQKLIKIKLAGRGTVICEKCQQ